MRIKQFIDEQWVEYADYDNRRSLPNLIDGLKITQRKALYMALKLPKGDKAMKVSQFASKAAGETAYQHGEASMMSTVVNLAQDFPGTNNYPLLEKHGQFGSRLSAEAASPRYIHTKLHQNWDRFFKKEDQDIVEPQFDDGSSIEPKFYIPILPMLLLNGVEGVGNGFSSTILTYDEKSIVKGLNELIAHNEVDTPLIPFVNGFTGKIEKVERQVSFKGKLKVVHGTKLHITELPPGYDNDKYKKLLKNLIDSKFIKDYENHSTEDKWDWIIECPRGTSALPMETLMKKFGLIGKVTENFVGWGINTKAPITFESPEALLTYWYHERLKLYAKSIAHQISVVKAGLVRLDLRIQFIEWCLKNDFRKLSKAQFIANSVAGIKRLTEELASEFVGMQMYKITTDEVKKMEDEFDRQVSFKEQLEKLTPISVMIENLKGL